MHFNNVQVPVKIIKTADFSSVYRSIHNFERKIPARVLRFCREQVYEIVQSQNPQSKIAVIDYDNIKDQKNIEIVFGLGVIGKVGETGYRSFTLLDIFEDIIYNNKDFSPEKVLKITVRQLGTKCHFIPIFKYISQMGVTSVGEYEESGLDLDFYLKRNVPAVFSSGAVKSFEKYQHLDFAEFIEAASESAFLTLAPYHDNVDLDLLEKYIVDNYTRLMSSNKKYYFRKLICFYDWLKYKF